jgi:hypothetical protein
MNQTYTSTGYACQSLPWIDAADPQEFQTKSEDLGPASVDKSETH